MNKDSRDKQFMTASEAPGSLEALVSEAMSRVAFDKHRVATPDVDPITIALSSAVLSDDPDDRTIFISDLMAAGVTAEEVILTHTVNTARHLGELWSRNKISFVDVTIGVARLQETVRKLSGRHPITLPRGRRPNILLCLPDGEDHGFGLMVAAAEFEILGCRVTLSIGQISKEIMNLYKSQTFDMVGFSLSSNRRARAVAQLVKTLRTAPKSTPIVLGGGLAQTPNAKLQAELGVDYLSPDAKSALRYCDIELPSLTTTPGEMAEPDTESSKGDVK